MWIFESILDAGHNLRMQIGVFHLLFSIQPSYIYIFLMMSNNSFLFVIRVSGHTYIFIFFLNIPLNDHWEPYKLFCLFRMLLSRNFQRKSGGILNNPFRYLWEEHLSFMCVCVLFICARMHMWDWMLRVSVYEYLSVFIFIVIIDRI